MIKGTNKRFNKVFYPVLIEQFFFMLMSQIDIIMLTGVGLSTVAAVGLANQVLMIVTFLITIIHVGVSIRLIHSKEKDQQMMKSDITMSLMFNLVVTILVSVIVMLSIDPIMHMLNIPEDVYHVTKSFALALLLMNFVHTSNMLMGTILRVLELAKYVTMISILMSSINILLNGYVLYGSGDRFDSPVLMVAWATNISRIVGCILLMILISRYFIKVSLKQFNSDFFRKIISLGLPSAGENISYNFSQLVLTALIAGLGTLAVSSKMLTQTMTGFAFTFALSFAVANQIFLGKFIAKHKYTILHILVHKHLKITTLMSLAIVILIVIGFYIFGQTYFDEASFELILSLLLLSLLLEPIRAINVFLVFVLNVLGDVTYPVKINIIVTWVLLVPGAFLGIKFLSMGVIVVFILMILDELLRAILMLKRFNRKDWKKSIEKIGV
ncbi:MATE family efflux transporter [Macrococcus equi]|uniref:MATE family efflux transporter n=1 Tax=Macrococcus equi TaxID=3395462 RepID=UPI0039BE15D0